MATLEEQLDLIELTWFVCLCPGMGATLVVVTALPRVATSAHVVGLTIVIVAITVVLAAPSLWYRMII